MRDRSWILLATALVTWALIVSPAADAADRCSVTDLSCVTDTAGRSVGQTVSTGAKTAGEAIETTTHAVAGALDRVGGTGGGTGRTGGGAGGTGGGTGGTAGGAGAPPPGGEHRRGSPVGQGHITAASSWTRGTLTMSPRLEAGSTPAFDVQRHEASAGGTLAPFAARVTAGAALLLTLVGMVFGFVLVQERIDRRDPRLAPTSFGSDRIAFR
jgi:hypothetical protein